MKRKSRLLLRGLAGLVLVVFPAAGVLNLRGRVPDAAWVALTPAGELLLADSANHRVLLVTPGGALSVLAGGAGAGSDGDNGPAWAALLNQVSGVAASADGVIYVVDTGNNRVRVMRR